jgi:hypothetical protein
MALPFASDDGAFSGSRDGRTGGSPISLSALYSSGPRPYGPRRFNSSIRQEVSPAMRAETEKLVDEIKQGITLLRRHL